MCHKCGMRGPHTTAEACIDCLRDLLGALQMRAVPNVLTPVLKRRRQKPARQFASKKAMQEFIASRTVTYSGNIR